MLVAQPRATVIALALAAMLAVPTPVGSVEVTVRATTTLTIDADTEGRYLEVQGALRDNLNQGLADQAVHLTLAPVGQGVMPRPRRARHIAITATTDRNGLFQVAETLSDGIWVLRAEYEGDELHGRASAQTQVEIRRHRLNVELRAPVASPQWAAIPVRLTALAAGVSTARLPFRVRINRRAVDLQLMTDSAGAADGHLEPSGRAGRARIEVVFDGNPVFEPVVVRRVVRLYDQAQISLRAQVQTLREADFLTIAGRLSGDGRPIAGARIELRVASQADSRWVETDSEGRFQLADVLENVPAGTTQTVFAHFDPHASEEPDLRVSASTDFVIERAPLAGARNWAGWVAAVLLSGLLIGVAVAQLLKGGNRRREDEDTLPPPGRMAPEGMVELSPQRRGRANLETRINGIVRDADTAEPLEDGDVEVEQSRGDHAVFPIATDGSFSTGRLPPGHYPVRITATGYVATRLEVKIPHRGQYSDIEVYVCSVRSWVRYLYQRLVYELNLDEEGKAGWGRATPRQIERLLVRTYRAFSRAEPPDSGLEAFRDAIETVISDPQKVPSDRILRALTLLVEEVYYSSRTYTEDMIELCQSLIDGVGEITGGQSPGS